MQIFLPFKLHNYQKFYTDDEYLYVFVFSASRLFKSFFLRGQKKTVKENLRKEMCQILQKFPKKRESINKLKFNRFVFDNQYN